MHGPREGGRLRLKLPVVHPGHPGSLCWGPTLDLSDLELELFPLQQERRESFFFPVYHKHISHGLPKGVKGDWAKWGGLWKEGQQGHVCACVYACEYVCLCR